MRSLKLSARLVIRVAPDGYGHHVSRVIVSRKGVELGEGLLDIDELLDTYNMRAVDNGDDVGVLSREEIGIIDRDDEIVNRKQLRDLKFEKRSPEKKNAWKLRLCR